MTYQSTIDFLYSQLPQYQKIGGKAYKASLANIEALCKVLENPERKIKTIHIAGTNGKGSTSSLLASVLTESGYKVGLFTSPHLIDFRERIAVNGQMIAKQFVVDFVAEYKELVKEIQPSFFEWTMALAFYYFEHEKVDVAIIETGLGGRLDSSNVVEPLVSAITTIAIEHTQYLGNTLKEIAFEKGGIIKTKTPVVIGYGIEGEALLELKRLAKLNESKFVVAQKLERDYKSGLLGGIQQYNIATVLAVLNEVKVVFENVNKITIESGLKNVTRNTLLRGRWEMLETAPKIVADIAHNVQAVEIIVKQLAKENFRNLAIVWGMVEDKDIEKVVDLLPNNTTYYLCEPKINRAMPLEKLANFFKRKNIVLCNSCKDAYEKGKKELKENDFLLVSGSNFVVSEVLEG